jgi:hypothetical protein
VLERLARAPFALARDPVERLGAHAREEAAEVAVRDLGEPEDPLRVGPAVAAPRAHDGLLLDLERAEEERVSRIDPGGPGREAEPRRDEMPGDAGGQVLVTDRREAGERADERVDDQRP